MLLSDTTVSFSLNKNQKINYNNNYITGIRKPYCFRQSATEGSLTSRHEGVCVNCIVQSCSIISRLKNTLQIYTAWKSPPPGCSVITRGQVQGHFDCRAAPPIPPALQWSTILFQLLVPLDRFVGHALPFSYLRNSDALHSTVYLYSIEIKYTL